MSPKQAIRQNQVKYLHIRKLLTNNDGQFRNKIKLTIS